ncbi:DUF2589 domain-containing protein [Ferrimonas sediminicola]|uniref:DUF2589 domain-containing protein n=1 Tax=Ferrimonas sediminicola TaxID=2569538 RepID=A0A4U1B9U4_9GAMM|nr:DUF2589 domain-containing protein [Ferrimonas sediminicola]TKB47326.1 DUF2589 domain-containing protein [Ferrimonas sediminicola]
MSVSKINDQLQGLPLSHLIGGPLAALCEGQAQLAHTTEEFIQQVGFTEDHRVRVVEFHFDRPLEHTNDDGSVEVRLQQYRVQLPFLSVISVPNLAVEHADIRFTMEVKSSHYRHRQGGAPALKSGLPKEKQAVLRGSVTSRHPSHSGATLEVNVNARQQGTPEGLSRILDLLHKSIVPVEVGEPRPLPQPSEE